MTIARFCMLFSTATAAVLYEQQQEKKKQQIVQKYIKDGVINEREGQRYLTLYSVADIERKLKQTAIKKKMENPQPTAFQRHINGVAYDWIKDEVNQAIEDEKAKREKTNQAYSIALRTANCDSEKTRQINKKFSSALREHNEALANMDLINRDKEVFIQKMVKNALQQEYDALEKEYGNK